jgi:hypothetical protein
MGPRRERGLLVQLDEPEVPKPLGRGGLGDGHRDRASGDLRVRFRLLERLGRTALPVR